ncbi:hypothetical protein BLOT_002551 [Blomia tropicalis]|nr:hypothetical protein BLOT_002551 [Blomia tropicalis]
MLAVFRDRIGVYTGYNDGDDSIVLGLLCTGGAKSITIEWMKSSAGRLLLPPHNCWLMAE